MAFTGWNTAHLAHFNSATSAKLLTICENAYNKAILDEADKKSSSTFAASSFRCKRWSWFRLRGTKFDKPKTPDRTLYHIANMGTACHKELQQAIRNYIGKNWVDVEQYMKDAKVSHIYKLERSDDGLETLVEMYDIPFRFACDGIIKIDDKYYLLEIKSCDPGTWKDLVEPKSEHIAQVTCYTSLLNLQDVLFVYVDRLYGDFKCYSHTVTPAEQEAMFDQCYEVIECVTNSIAPDPLPKGDKWCTPSMCPYYSKCKEYGR